MIWTIKNLLEWTSDFFKKHHIEKPHLEAEILLAHVLEKKRIEIYTNFDKVVSEKELANFKQKIKRRSLHEPIAYITGFQPFMGIDIIVDQSVLIPRPETELLVEKALDYINQAEGFKVADIGTGSGAIAIALVKYLPDIKVIGIDTSADAIKIAQKNAQYHNLSNRIEFRQGNLLEPLNEKVDLIISNPPYIPSEQINKLETDVKDWEPKGALDGGIDGMDYIKQLIDLAPNHLKPNHLLLIEIDYSQGQKVKEYAEKSGNFVEIEIMKDLNKNDRILKALYKPAQ